MSILFAGTIDESTHQCAALQAPTEVCRNIERLYLCLHRTSLFMLKLKSSVSTVSTAPRHCSHPCLNMARLIARVDVHPPELLARSMLGICEGTNVHLPQRYGTSTRRGKLMTFRLMRTRLQTFGLRRVWRRR